MKCEKCDRDAKVVLNGKNLCFEHLNKFSEQALEAEQELAKLKELRMTAQQLLVETEQKIAGLSKELKEAQENCENLANRIDHINGQITSLGAKQAAF